MRRARRHLTYANVTATLALFLVLGGGSALASFVINSNHQVRRGTISGHHPPKGDHANVIGNSINGRDVANHSLTRADIDKTRLGRVPSAVHADSATSADTATDADKLGGQPASDYRLHCPSGLVRAGDLCFEPQARAPADFETALKQCALDQLRLPSLGEVALIYDHLSPSPFSLIWAASYSGKPGAFKATAVALGNSRNLEIHLADTTANVAFRCVTSATN
jgi:hypothetical protein